MRTVATALFVCSIAFAAPVTFNKDVLPVLQKHCQECHRPGEIAPMSFLNYEQTRPWAKAIKTAVMTHKMPPWPVDPEHSKHFSNDRSLSKEDIAILTKWADSGAAAGYPSDAPTPRTWVEGWNITLPDAVLEMPHPFDVEAKGTVEYQYIVVPTGFTEDKWIQMAEVRPSNRPVVHHAVIWIRPAGSKWLADAKPGVPYVPPAQNMGQKLQNIGGGGSDILTIYTPGMNPDVWQPGMAKEIKVGSDLIFQMHYTAAGKAGADKTKVGLVFAKEPPRERVITVSVANPNFTIPPGDPNYKVEGRVPINNEATLLSVFPHMHLRGKAMEYDVTYPTGEKDQILTLARYDLNWQLSYKLDKPIKLPKGSKVHVAGYFDNSPNNPANPDPSATVKFGEQSWEEMMIGFMDVAVDSGVTQKTFFMTRPKPAAE